MNALAGGQGFFVAVEGVDGSGKSTLVLQMAAALREQAITTHEPNEGYAAGTYIRQVLAREFAVSPAVLTMAYALNRADHTERLIVPRLAAAAPGAPCVVISDRYYLSSLAYQVSPEQPLAAVMALNQRARRPDLHIFLDVATETAYTRIGSRSQRRDLFDERLAEMREKYEAAIQFLELRGEQVLRVDASGTPAEVFSQTVEAMRGCAAVPAWLVDALGVPSTP